MERFKSAIRADILITKNIKLIYLLHHYNGERLNFIF